MQTKFSAQQLADPAVAHSEKILRKCVHCGFCTATCPTYITLGNELDSPRGRIYLIKDMLENGRPADAEIVKHIDRCLSCLSCMTTCPSGVDYMHLVDHARIHIEKTYKRPLINRLIRLLLAQLLPYPARLQKILFLSRLVQPFAPVLRTIPALHPLAAMLELAPKNPVAKTRIEKKNKVNRFHGTLSGQQQRRVALLSGCAQRVLDPAINAASICLLERFGVEIVTLPDEGCCGALVHHMGRETQALALARHNIDIWMDAIDEGGLDAIVTTASGCGTTMKDYAHMLRLDPLYAEKAAKIAQLSQDISEYLNILPLPKLEKNPMRVAYHAACSLQHGQKITTIPKTLLKAAGFHVLDPAEGHLCCGSAGTYNMLQPEISARLRARKVRNIEATKADVIATGNLGCITQIAAGTKIPVLHTVELLSWAYGGATPTKLEPLAAHGMNKKIFSKSVDA